MLGRRGGASLAALLQRGALVPGFDLRGDLERVLMPMRKYAALPMSLADACLVRMTEVLSDPVLLTTDADFRIYRRHGRQTVPATLP